MCSQFQRLRCHRTAVFVLIPILTLGQPIAINILTHLITENSYQLGMSQIIGDAAWAAETNASTDQSAVKYTCPMHPHYIADEMGTCPICGMDLVKLETGGDSLSITAGKSRTIITISSETIQNTGVRLSKAEASSFGRNIRSYGIVHENERKRTEITARVEGWVEDLRVTAVGDHVKKGDLLFKLYSPQLIVSQSDFLNSLGQRGLASRGKNQLRAFGVQDQAIAEIRKRKQPMQLVPFYAEQDGTVAELTLLRGTYVKRGMMVAKIQDYSNVWLKVGVSEKDLSFIQNDTSALVTFPNLPGRLINARVDYIYPTVDTTTRTGQVRLVITNKDGVIRPGSYADVVFEVGVEKRLSVPSEAVLRNGSGRYVVASLGKGRFEPRLIEAGLISGDRTEIKRGVIEGENVVVSGQFLLDSESALRESFRKLQRLQVPLSLLKLTKNEFAMIDHLIDASLYIHEALVDGYDVDPKQLDPAISIKDFLWPRYKNTQLAFVLSDAVAALKQLQEARTETQLQTALATLNNTLRAWVVKGAPEHYKAKKLSAFQDEKSERIWFQVGARPFNPFARGGGKLIAYPEPVGTSVTEADAKKTTSSVASKAGSHSGH